MSLDPVSRLAETIAATSNDQQTVKQNLSADDPDSLLQLQSSETLRLTGTLIATQYTYPTNSFIIDHPVYGVIDSATLLIDGGYVTNVVTIPVTIPVLLGAAATVLYSTTF
jgi:hypothetical protein